MDLFISLKKPNSRNNLSLQLLYCLYSILVPNVDFTGFIFGVALCLGCAVCFFVGNWKLRSWFRLEFELIRFWSGCFKPHKISCWSRAPGDPSSWWRQRHHSPFITFLKRFLGWSVCQRFIFMLSLDRL